MKEIMLMEKENLTTVKKIHTYVHSMFSSSFFMNHPLAFSKHIEHKQLTIVESSMIIVSFIPNDFVSSIGRSFEIKKIIHFSKNHYELKFF